MGGLQDPEMLITLVGGFSHETNDKVWTQLGAVLGGLDTAFKQGLSQEVTLAFQQLAAKLVQPAFKTVGWDASPQDDDNRRKLRSILVDCVAKFCVSDPEIAAEAVRRCRAFLASPNECSCVSADIRLAVLSIALEHPEHFDELHPQLLKAHDTLNDQARRLHIYRAVGRCPSLALRKRPLEWSLTDAVRSQDFIYIPSGIASSGPEGAEMWLSWLRQEWDQIYGRLGEASMI